jgi:hypothetical protein
MSDHRRGFGSVIGFTVHLYTQLVTTSNYSAIANLHTLQISRARSECSQSVVTLSTSRFLGTTSNSEYSSASALTYPSY